MKLINFLQDARSAIDTIITNRKGKQASSQKLFAHISNCKILGIFLFYILCEERACLKLPNVICLYILCLLFATLL